VRFLERHGMRLVGALVVLFLAQWIVRGWIVPEWSPDPIGAQSASATDDRPAATPRQPTPRVRTATRDETAPQPATAPPDDGDVFATLHGRVVDAASGKPVAHAALRWGYVGPAKDELQKEIWGGTNDDGSLSFLLLRTIGWASERPDAVAELWVAAPGYAPAKVRAPAPHVEIRLEPAPYRPPGRLRIRALREDGVPYKGLVRVEATEEFGDVAFGQGEDLRGIADADGRFTLYGVPSRFRRIRIDDRMPWTDVVVPPDGSVDVDLRGPPAGPFADLAEAAVIERRDAAQRAMDDATVRAADDEILHRTSDEQRPLVIENLPADSAPLVKVGVDATHTGVPIVWRLPVENRSVSLSTSLSIVSWGVSVTRAGGGVDTRFVLLLPTKDGTAYETLPDAATKRSFPLRDDGTLVVDWNLLDPPRK